MLDYRHQTFLELCKLKNYARTAAALHLTQPAVSQHIQHLEKHYGTSLIAEKGRRFALTAAGHELLLFIQAANNGLTSLKKRMTDEKKRREIVIGATRSVGESLLPRLLAKTIPTYGDVSFSIVVENTRVLMELMENGEIHFALIEGFFGHSTCESIPFSDEPFICVRSADKAPTDTCPVTIETLTNETLVVREPGSGSRAILEAYLHGKHLQLASFRDQITVNNVAAIKKLARYGCGVTFLYRFSVMDELSSGKLYEVAIEDWHVNGKLHFVYPKNSLIDLDYLALYRELLDHHREGIQCSKISDN